MNAASQPSLDAAVAELAAAGARHADAEVVMHQRMQAATDAVRAYEAAQEAHAKLKASVEALLQGWVASALPLGTWTANAAHMTVSSTRPGGEGVGNITISLDLRVAEKAWTACVLSSQAGWVMFPGKPDADPRKALASLLPAVSTVASSVHGEMAQPVATFIRELLGEAP